MNESKMKAQATRERNQEAQRRWFAEQAESIRAARLAPQRVMEREDATPAEILEASRLLVELGRW